MSTSRSGSAFLSSACSFIWVSPRCNRRRECKKIRDRLDKETNNHYNYYRDYSPEIGRYVESDPIGLRGGLNPYTYVGGNPISRTDPKGLEAAVTIPAPTLPAPGTGTGLGGLGGRILGACIGRGLGVLGLVLTASSISACQDYPEPKGCNSNDDECKKKRDVDESLCVAIAGRYGRQGVAICMQSAATRYSECLRFGVDGITTPLHGVDTPL